MTLLGFSQHQAKKDLLFQKLITSCQYLLHHDSLGQKAKEYLNTRIPEELQVQFQFGYFPDNQNLSSLLNSFNKEDLRFLKLSYPKTISDNQQLLEIEHGVLSQHNLFLPYHDCYGKVISLVGRTLLNKEEQKKLEISKYKNPFFYKSLHLFNLHRALPIILQQDRVIVVEGQFDCLALWNKNIKNTVALGGGNFSNYQLQLLLRYTKNIDLLLDSDLAGKKAVNKIIKKHQNLADFDVLELPEKYNDIDQYLKFNNDILDIVTNNNYYGKKTS